MTQPDSVCAALGAEGLVTAGWKPSKSMPGEWLCMTSLVPFGAPGANGMANNIAYYVSGKSKGRIADVIIKVNVNNLPQRSQAQWRREVATATWFKAMGVQVPPELRDALTKLKPASVDLPFGRAELTIDTARIQSFKVVLTAADTIQAAESLRSGSRAEFDACRSVVARAVGYEVDLIKGDGKPTQESGYKSFMLQGRSRDLFFCEVHGSAKYRVKAAIGGNFPFRYIAEGKF